MLSWIKQKIERHKRKKLIKEIRGDLEFLGYFLPGLSDKELTKRMAQSAEIAKNIGVTVEETEEAFKIINFNLKHKISEEENKKDTEVGIEE